MSALTEAIDRIMKRLQQDTPELASYLLPGLTRAEIEESGLRSLVHFPAWQVLAELAES